MLIQSHDILSDAHFRDLAIILQLHFLHFDLAIDTFNRLVQGGSSRLKLANFAHELSISVLACLNLLICPLDSLRLAV